MLFLSWKSNDMKYIFGIVRQVLKNVLNFLFSFSGFRLSDFLVFIKFTAFVTHFPAVALSTSRYFNCIYTLYKPFDSL